jgi:hypothetical protein
MDYQVVAESVVHPGRVLMVGRDGDGYIKLETESTPIAVPELDFVRLLAMSHYRFVEADLNLSHIGVAVERYQIAV